VDLQSFSGAIAVDGSDIFQMYEKHYFHEIESREKLTARIQIPLTLLVSFVGVLAFLLQNFGGQSTSKMAAVFVGLLVLTFLALLAAAYCLIRSWYNNIYEFLPSSEESEKYYETLRNHYAPYEDSEKLTKDAFARYLQAYYVKCATANALSNDRRTFYLHETNTALIFAAAVAFCAFSVFHFGNLDKSNVKAPAEVTIVGPVRTLDESKSTQQMGSGSSDREDELTAPQPGPQEKSISQHRRKKNVQ
jgi:hypothetical protein